MNSTLFLTGFGIYVLFLIWLGWFVSRNQKSGEDFLLGGRGLPLFLVLGTTVATMVGTGSRDLVMPTVGRERSMALAAQSAYCFWLFGLPLFVNLTL